MKIKVVILILNFFLLLNSQNYIPFPLENVIWTIDGDNGSSWSEPFLNFQTFYTTGDTVINNYNYTKINSKYKTDYCFLREANMKVYCRYNFSAYNDTSEFILFDFSLNLGDTMFFNSPANQNNNTDEYSIVYRVDSVLIGNKYHRTIEMSTWAGLTFIEGVGAKEGLMYNEVPWVDFYEHISCFSINDTIYDVRGSGDTENGKCDISTGIENIIQNNLNIYPNPSSAYIYIGEVDFAKYELFDLNGQILKTEMNPSINILKLDKGVYFLKVYLNDDTVHVSKIFKK